MEIEAPADANLLEVLLSEGIDMPYFCWHPAMGSVGACRQCAVVGYANEDDTRGRIVMSCMTPIMDGARFSVSAENATLFRDSVIENLMLNHPHDCPVCEEGGECHLQDMTVMVGHRDRRYTGLKTTFKNQYLGPFIGHEMNRCITCYRCVRYYQDYAGGDDLGAFGSRDRVFFGRAEAGVLENEFAGNLVEVCPTGVFTDKTLSSHYTRKWDLQSSPTICQGCSLGCNTYTSERYGELRRVHNRYHNEVNSYFLCDRGRFGGQHVNSDKRIPQAGIRNSKGLYDPTPLDTALNEVKSLLSGGGKVVGVGSPRASLEANQALRLLVGADNYCNGMSDTDREMSQVILDALQSKLNTPSMMEVEDYDAILVVGEDITNHAPRLALSVRQAVRNESKVMADSTGISGWHDAAVRELAQHDRSPLIILTPAADRLDDVASETHRLSPTEIIEMTVKITDAFDQEEPSHAKDIAEILANTKKPLIITGTSLGSADVLRAAVNLTIALTGKNSEAGIFLCASECNSLGVALIDNDHSLETQLASEPDVAIVLENDLKRRLGTKFDDTMAKVKQLVVVDCIDNATASQSNIALPAASFAESEGSFVNNEGRVQRSFAVFTPAGDIAPSYQLLTAIAGDQQTATGLQASLASEFSNLAPIARCAPDENFRIEGSKIARMTHRASGRTAMLADVSVHEPKQPQDPESALAYTMEGNQDHAPASLRAYTWAPGWNSNQSIHKFQSEVGGPDKTEVPGLHLFAGTNELTPYNVTASASSLVPQHHIFGSDLLSSYADELSTLAPAPYARMNRAMAESLGVNQGDGLAAGNVQMTVLIDERVADGCVAYPQISETVDVAGAAISDLKPVTDFNGPADPLRPSLITTDRTS